MALSNLSYYMTQTDSFDTINESPVTALTTCLIQLLSTQEISLPLIRQLIACLGNLSRDKEASIKIISSQIDKLILTLLESSDADILYVSTGVLINLTSFKIDNKSESYMKDLIKNGLINKLNRILETLASTDYDVCIQCLQIVWNLWNELVSLLNTGNTDVDLGKECICLLDRLNTLSHTFVATQSFNQLTDIESALLEICQKLINRLNSSIFAPVIE